MKKTIPLTASAQSTGISPEHQRYLSSLDRGNAKGLGIRQDQNPAP